MQYYNRNVLFCIYFKTIIDFINISVIKRANGHPYEQGQEYFLIICVFRF